jgi:CRP-like cAMP-binding protein
MNTLDGIDVLDALTSEERAKIAKLCRWKKYTAQEQIFDRQSEQRDVFFVVKGRVKIVIYSLSGREVTLDDVLQGSFFGELAALDGEPRSASVMALEDTVLAILSAESFLEMLQEFPEISLNVMQRMAEIIRQATDRILDLSTLGANNRVHAEVLRMARLAEEDANGRPIIRPIPVHSDMASRVSTTRETVARVMNDLARNHILKRNADHLLIEDLDRLEDMVLEVRGF